MRQLPGVIMPFPGGVVRSGSKVGSKYKELVASTNDAYCPTLKAESRALGPAARGRVRCSRSSSTGSPRPTSAHATAVGVRAACEPGAEGRDRGDQRRQLRRQARPLPLPPAQGAGVTAVVLTPQGRSRAPGRHDGRAPGGLAGQPEGTSAAMPLRVGNRQVPLGELFGVARRRRARGRCRGRVRAASTGLARGMTAGPARRPGRRRRLSRPRHQRRPDRALRQRRRLRRGGDARRADHHRGRCRRLPRRTAARRPARHGGRRHPGRAGNVGDRAGDRMRRGTIAVGGSAGAWLASRFIGGTILAGRRLRVLAGLRHAPRHRCCSPRRPPSRPPPSPTTAPTTCPGSPCSTATSPTSAGRDRGPLAASAG